MAEGSSSPETAAAVSVVSARTATRPEIAVVLGSGLGGLAGDVAGPVSIPYREIPGFPVTTVPGHAGELILGTLEGVQVAVMKGRPHLYEGFTPEQVGFPVRLMHALGARTLIATNAAGSLRADLLPGAIMVLEDHINIPGLGGMNPLIGVASGSERFVGMAGAYDPRLRQLALDAAAEIGLHAASGVYAMVMGPSYETPAEGRMLRAWGADAVGMSTVPEVIVARWLGMRVLAISSITNLVLHAPDHGQGGHSEVLAAAEKAAGGLVLLLRNILRHIGNNGL